MKLSLPRFKVLFIVALSLVALESSIFGMAAYSVLPLMKFDSFLETLLIIAKAHVYVIVHWYALIVIKRSIKHLNRSESSVVSVSNIQKVILFLVLGLLTYVDGGRFMQLVVLLTVDVDRDFIQLMDEIVIWRVALVLAFYVLTSIIIYYAVVKLLLSSFIKTTIKRNRDVVTLDA
ncbi:MAG: hypothetical protein HWE14_03680 [Flavobacteriia bacterium]|nr:hypothetical protein [Flavobacteriia bacterium]